MTRADTKELIPEALKIHIPVPEGAWAPSLQVVLPALRSDTAAAHVRRQPMATPAHPPTSPEEPSPRVLLVEDDESDAELTLRMLRVGGDTQGLVAARVATVRDALAYLGSHKVDLLLLDLGLPDSSRLSGLESILAARPTLPIVVVTGSAEGRAGVDAVHAGAQDFLVKDQVTAAVLEKSIRYAMLRARAIQKEKQLLEETLHGTIQALTTVLSLVNPTAFGRAQRLKEYVAGPASALGIRHQWTVEVAAMVSQLGWVQHSPEECEQHYAASETVPERRRLVQDMPAIAAELLAGIPHLESVREMLALQQQRSRGRVRAERQRLAPDVWTGMELLFIATEFDILETRTGSKEAAIEELRKRQEEFEDTVFRAFIGSQQQTLDSSSVRLVSSKELVEGMILADDVTTPEGRVVVARGHEVTPSMLARLRFFGERSRIAEPIRIQAPRSRGMKDDAEAA